jgi:heme/copper-type cytochrome/quinol oxidase subunit 2
MNVNDLLGYRSNTPASDWMIFLVMLGAIGIAIAIVVVWMAVFRTKAKKRRKRHRRRHSQQHNTTLAESGGLPPMRDPNQPPPGP